MYALPVITWRNVTTSGLQKVNTRREISIQSPEEMRIVRDTKESLRRTMHNGEENKLHQTTFAGSRVWCTSEVTAVTAGKHGQPLARSLEAVLATSGRKSVLLARNGETFAVCLGFLKSCSGLWCEVQTARIIEDIHKMLLSGIRRPYQNPERPFQKPRCPLLGRSRIF